MFYSKQVSDTNGFKNLQKYAIFPADSQSFWHCRRNVEHVVVLSN